MKLLLDCHIPKAVVVTLSRRCGLEVAHLAEWRGGAFRAAQDADILAACFEEGRTLVTYDQRSIPGLLRCWAAEERPHAGVVFGDSNTVPANDPGAVAHALLTLVEETGGADMTDVILYQRPARSRAPGLVDQKHVPSGSPKEFLKRHAPRKIADPAKPTESPKAFFKWLRQRQSSTSQGPTAGDVANTPYPEPTATISDGRLAPKRKTLSMQPGWMKPTAFDAMWPGSTPEATHLSETEPCCEPNFLRARPDSPLQPVRPSH